MKSGLVGWVPSAESGKIGVVGGLGGVEFIDQIIFMPKTFEAFLLLIFKRTRLRSIYLF